MAALLCEALLKPCSVCGRACDRGCAGCHAACGGCCAVIGGCCDAACDAACPADKPLPIFTAYTLLVGLAPAAYGAAAGLAAAAGSSCDRPLAAFVAVNAAGFVGVLGFAVYLYRMMAKPYNTGLGETPFDRASRLLCYDPPVAGLLLLVVFLVAFAFAGRAWASEAGDCPEGLVDAAAVASTFALAYVFAGAGVVLVSVSVECCRYHDRALAAEPGTRDALPPAAAVAVPAVAAAASAVAFATPIFARVLFGAPAAAPQRGRPAPVVGLPQMAPAYAPTVPPVQQQMPYPPAQQQMPYPPAQPTTAAPSAPPAASVFPSPPVRAQQQVPPAAPPTPFQRGQALAGSLLGSTLFGQRKG